jgi:hypothetical protein
MKIYVLVEVTYDWYRFQQNLYASNSITEINKYLHGNIISEYHKSWQVEWSISGTEKHDESENSHLWVQEF